MTRATTLLLGVAIGAVGVVLYQRLREVVEEENPDALVDRISKQLEALEERTRRTA